MTLSIRNGRLQGVAFAAANSFGGPIEPSLIVLHDTAGRLDKGNSVAWFRSRNCTTSAHVVIERDGSMTQMVPFNRKAFHAGQSEWDGRRFCNGFSIGIEIVNPGKLDQAGKAWFGPATSESLVRKSTREHGDGWWLPYTPEQIDAVKRLCRAIVAEYPDCNEIVTHWMVSPKRKIDPNPLFPLEEVRAYAFGAVEPDTADVPAQPVKPPPTSAGAIAADGSRSMTWLQRLKAALFGSGAAVTTFFGADTFGGFRSTLNDLKALLADHAMVVILGGIGVVLGVVLLVQHYLVLAHREGRYDPAKRG